MPSQTVLSIHNFYREPGGEDRVFEAESALFDRQAHRVVRYEDRNDRISNGLVTGITSAWNHASYRGLRQVAASTRPDVAHFHNTFPLISPAGYYAAKRMRVPVVQTLSNFRVLCPGGLLMRDGKTVRRVHRAEVAASGDRASMLAYPGIIAGRPQRSAE